MIISVLGAGAWGTALAIQLARAGHEVRLWMHDPARAQALQQTRRTPYLAEVLLPNAISVVSDLEQTLVNSDAVLIVVPSHVFSELLERLARQPSLPSHIAWATKGFDAQDHQLLHTLFARLVGVHFPDVQTCVISGPTFAQEVAQGLPTAIVAASPQQSTAQWWVDALHTGHFRVYTHTDMIGVEVGGAMKNIMAIAAGVSDGLGFGANARAALIARALAEMMRLGQALGARADTLMGLTGLGDLVLTCTDDQSRNRRFGMALATGQSVAQAAHTIGTVEGLQAVDSAVVLGKRYQLDLPIVSAVYALVHNQLSANEAVAQLLAREAKAEM